MKNQSLYCNNSYIDLGKQFMAYNKDISFSIWINLQKQNEEMAILSQNNARSGIGRFSCGFLNNKIYVYTGEVGNTFGKTELNLNHWYHIAFVYCNNVMKCYLNGHEELSVKINGFQDSNSFLFSYYKGNDYYLNGYVDEFKMYNYALNEDEIKKNMYKIEKNYSNLIIYFNFNKILDNDNVLNLVTNQKYKIYNLNRLSKEIVPPLQFYKYLIKQNNNYYSLKSSFYELGQPQDNNEKEQFYKENGIDDLNSLVEKKNGKSVNLKLDKNDIYKTVILINFNEITDKIEYIYKDNKKEIKYNTEKYQLLDLIKKSIGNKFQIGKWEEK